MLGETCYERSLYWKRFVFWWGVEVCVCVRSGLCVGVVWEVCMREVCVVFMYM